MRHALLGEKTVYKGPIPISAIQQQPQQQGVGGGKVVAPAAVSITVRFDLQDGSGGLALNTSAVCPPAVLNVYCRRDHLLGFEVYRARFSTAICTRGVPFNFQQAFATLEALPCVRSNGMPLGWHMTLTVATMYRVVTVKARCS